MGWKPAKKLAAVLAATALTITGCSNEGDGPDESALKHFGYQLSTPLVTTNAGSMVGESLKMQRLSGRIYPGAFIPGPSGQRIPNTDLISAQVLPGPQRQVVYTLSDKAVFSDGVPVTCDDYALAHTAGTNPEIFSSHMPQMQHVEKLDCTPGSKEFTVVFEEGTGGRWRELFGAGTVLPAHAIAKRLEMETAQLTELLQAYDPDTLTRTAEVWRFGFALGKFDPELQISYGPFKIESVGQEGEVTLVPNENYYGDAPNLERIVVWPSTKDSAELQEAGALMIGDLADHNPEWYTEAPEPDDGAHADDVVTGSEPKQVDPEGDAANDADKADADKGDAEAEANGDAGDNATNGNDGTNGSNGDAGEAGEEELSPQELQTVIGEMTDTLIFANAGLWAAPENRRALSQCIDNEAVARASSSVAGIDLPVFPVHVLPQNDPLSRRLGDIANPNLAVDVEAARYAAGLEIRIGYAVPSPRLASMVEAIKRSCEPAGITVTDVSGPGKTRADLMTEQDTWNPERETIDAFLGAVDPMSEYETSNARSGELRSLREEERRLWEEIPSIPLSAQPRTFIVDRNISNVVVYTGPVGIGWNMDRWRVPGLEPKNNAKKRDDERTDAETDDANKSDT